MIRFQNEFYVAVKEGNRFYYPDSSTIFWDMESDLAQGNGIWGDLSGHFNSSQRRGHQLSRDVYLQQNIMDSVLFMRGNPISIRPKYP